MIYILVFVLLVDFTCSAHKLTKYYNKTENILCRDCGTEILNSDAIISKHSAASLYSFNDTIFNRKEVLVQLLHKDILFSYPVITSSDSTCLGKGDWEDDNIWFPDYSVRPCFCPECGDFIGWIFQNDDPSVIHKTDKFFGLVLTGLIGENFLNNLITYPHIRLT